MSRKSREGYDKTKGQGLSFFVAFLGKYKQAIAQKVHA